MPKISASLVVAVPFHNPNSLYNYRVLMVQRVTKAKLGSFNSAQVFPGGLIEPQDYQHQAKDPLKVCALRETFEETGLALAGYPSPSSSSLSDIRPLARWVTPRAQPRRFDTVFGLLAAPEIDPAQVKLQQKEVAGMDWVAPDQILQANANRQVPLLPPQFYILHEISKYRQWQDLVEATPPGSFDRLAPIEPLLQRQKDGQQTIALLPGDREYPYCSTTASHPALPRGGNGSNAVVADQHRICMSEPAQTGGGFFSCCLSRSFNFSLGPKL